MTLSGYDYQYKNAKDGVEYFVFCYRQVEDELRYEERDKYFCYSTMMYHTCGEHKIDKMVEDCYDCKRWQKSIDEYNRSAAEFEIKKKMLESQLDKYLVNVVNILCKE